MTIQRSIQQKNSIGIYAAIIIIMAIVVQFGFPAFVPDTLTIRFAWSAMVGISSGWCMVFLVYKISNSRSRKLTNQRKFHQWAS